MFALMNEDFTAVVRLVESLDAYPPLRLLNPEQRLEAHLYDFAGDVNLDTSGYKVETGSSFIIDNTAKSVQRDHTYRDLNAEELTAKKNSICDLVKAHRDNLNLTGGCKVGTKWYHSDAYSKMQQLALKVEGIVGTKNWKTMDGSFVALDQAGIEAVVSAQVFRDEQVFTVGEVHQANIQACADGAALQAYDYLTGWPETFK